MTKIKLRHGIDQWGEHLNYGGKGNLSKVVTFGLMKRSHHENIHG